MQAVRDSAGKEDAPDVKRMCELLQVNRTSAYREPAPAGKDERPVTDDDEARMAVIDEVHLKLPASGARKMARECTKRKLPTTRYQATELMRRMNVKAVYPKPDTSKPAKQHPKFPYLLRGMKIEKPGQVWATDITYIRMGRGHMYLTCVIDWATRYVVGWRLSDTLEAGPVVECMEAAIAEHGAPEIANSDQGSTYTADEYVKCLERHGVRQSMDGKARWVDNVIVERWFRTLKSEFLRLEEYETPRELRKVIERSVELYNNDRLHESLGYDTPAERYFAELPLAA